MERDRGEGNGVETSGGERRGVERAVGLKGVRRERHKHYTKRGLKDQRKRRGMIEGVDGVKLSEM